MKEMQKAVIQKTSSCEPSLRRGQAWNLSLNCIAWKKAKGSNSKSENIVGVGDRCDYQEGGDNEGHCRVGSVWEFGETVLRKGDEVS